jgi:predicted porin
MSADSAIDGQLFSRAAWVGLESAQFGQITFGRHQTFFLENIGQFDPMRASQIFSPIGFSGTYSGGGNTEDSRVDNSVRWDDKFGDFRVGAMYKFGGVAGNTNAQSAELVNISYQSGPLSLVAGYQRFVDAFASSNGATIGTVAVTANNTTGYMLSGKYAIGDATLLLGYEREDLTNPSNPSANAIASLYGFPISGAVNVNPYAHGKILNVYWGGINYDVTKAWTLTAAYYEVKQNDFSGTGCAVASAKCSGTSKFFSLLADYKFSRRTDMYAGYMENNVSGGLGFGYFSTSNNIIGAGIRHRF